jgi:hypothetical protein
MSLVAEGHGREVFGGGESVACPSGYATGTITAHLLVNALSIEDHALLRYVLASCDAAVQGESGRVTGSVIVITIDLL